MLADIIDTYSKFNQLNIVAGDYGIGDVLYPYLLMDVQYSIYQKDIAPLKCTQRLKLIRKKWSEAYNRFNKRFFAPFSQEQMCEITDMMDAYTEHINNALIAARVAVMNAVQKAGNCPFEQQVVLSACSMCNILAQCAQIGWEQVHLNSFLERKPNLDIYGVENYSHLFSDEYMRVTGNIFDLNLNTIPGIDAAMNALSHKVYHFQDLVDYKNEQKAKTDAN